MSDPIWYKALANNDTGASSGKMAGFLVPQALVPLFPDLGLPSDGHPSSAASVRAELFLDGVYKGRADANFQFQTWGGTRPPEYRLTNELEPILGTASGMDLITIEVLETDLAYRIEVLTQGSAGYLNAMARRINKASGRGDWGMLRRAALAEAPLPPPQAQNAVDVEQPRIYATLTHGFDPEVWAAFGFSNQTVRNKLAEALRNGGGMLLSIGTMGEETPEPLQGKLLALHTLGTRAIRTGELVEPSHWAAHLDRNGGEPKWPFGLPIHSASRFDEPLVRRADLLPRLHDQNLHQKLASNYELLTPEEAAAVLALPRSPVTNLWRTPAIDFAAGLIRPPVGPQPSTGTHTLSRSSGPAATYCFELAGAAMPEVSKTVAPAGSGKSVFKAGFTNNPSRRLSELNAYLPDHSRLHWKPRLIQWHLDEINAWTMEQAVFTQLQARGGTWLKGEIYAAKPDVLDAAWNAAITSAVRPEGPVVIDSDSSEPLDEFTQ